MSRIVAVAALGFGLAALSAGPALALGPETLTVHVPFAFNVGDETLPAGDYSIKPLDDLEAQVLEIRSTDGRRAILTYSVDSSPVARDNQPELVFDKYGTKEFLHTVRLPDETGALLEPSPSELQAARDLTAPTAAHGSGGK